LITQPTLRLLISLSSSDREILSANILGTQFLIFIVKLQQRHQYLSFQDLFMPVEQIVLKTVHETSQGFRHRLVAVDWSPLSMTFSGMSISWRRG